MYYIILVIATFSTQAIAQESPIFPIGEKAPNVHHTGDVWIYHVSDADDTFDYNIVHVVMGPGAKLNWHVHPAGQIILATGGVGYYQEKGRPKRILEKGDVVKCPPDVPHWHGASSNQEFIQIAITGRQNGPTEW
ncbi:cupin domain-containing protein [Catalinimonas niigatensis]|uniref:cupin domain-containing protein n=1 Tax=Catalinimonas niigatensis TaxID=1397264 RepID=UPI0026668793|nr:cupin domain-containing protein [Catalinimonas niigatensis]WPP49153.1 cupin domain-containing protein [Catalinimonas niigatensis]